jgi:Icc-related predicted phosphoesterase
LLSDTHCKHPAVPDGDILIHAGDLTLDGSFREIAAEGNWLRSLPHKHKVLIAGNHDILFERNQADALVALGPGIVYLQDNEVKLEGLRIYGSPWQPEFCNWAFNLERGKALERVWRKIPEGLDILITHGPPYSYLDKGLFSREGKPVHSLRERLLKNEPLGCKDLRNRIREVPPKLHVFGHIHYGYGQEWMRDRDILLVNAAQGYHLEHKPVVLDWPLVRP